MSNNIEEIVSLIDDVRFRSGGQDEPHLFNPSGAMHGFQVRFQRIEKQSVKRWPVYTKHQRQHYDNSAMVLAILLPLQTMESLQKWGCNPFPSNSIVFNENRIASVIAEL